MYTQRAHGHGRCYENITPREHMAMGDVGKYENITPREHMAMGDVMKILHPESTWPWVMWENMKILHPESTWPWVMWENMKILHPESTWPFDTLGKYENITPREHMAIRYVGKILHPESTWSFHTLGKYYTQREHGHSIRWENITPREQRRYENIMAQKLQGGISYLPYILLLFFDFSSRPVRPCCRPISPCQIWK